MLQREGALLFPVPRAVSYIQRRERTEQRSGRRRIVADGLGDVATGLVSCFSTPPGTQRAMQPSLKQLAMMCARTQLAASIPALCFVLLPPPPWSLLPADVTPCTECVHRVRACHTDHRRAASPIWWFVYPTPPLPPPAPPTSRPPLPASPLAFPPSSTAPRLPSPPNTRRSSDSPRPHTHSDSPRHPTHDVAPTPLAPKHTPTPLAPQHTTQPPNTRLPSAPKHTTRNHVVVQHNATMWSSTTRSSSIPPTLP